MTSPEGIKRLLHVLLVHFRSEEALQFEAGSRLYSVSFPVLGAPGKPRGF